MRKFLMGALFLVLIVSQGQESADNIQNLLPQKTLENDTPGFDEHWQPGKKDQAFKSVNNEKQTLEIWRNVLLAILIGGALALCIFYRILFSKYQKAYQLLQVKEVLNAKLIEVVKRKTDFISNVSHEFRTPLSLILAPLENELKKKSAPGKKENMLLIKRSANRLLELVDQLLDISKLESGKMDLTIRKRDLKRHLSVIAASFDSLAEHKGISLILNNNLDDSGHWYDQDKMDKIVTNLLSNAIKYTPPAGQVKFQCCIDAGMLNINIADTGPGISEEDQDYVFTAFYQGNAATGQKQGYGLGLSLVKELVKIYKGTISFQSSPGEGSAFKVKLPLDKSSFASGQIIEESTDVPSSFAITHRALQNSGLKMQTESDLDGRDTILVIEDNIDLRGFISTTLQNNNFFVFTAQDGKDGLQAAVKNIPNLVLSDLMMPTLNGIELTSKIKNDERTSHIPVILLTGKSETEYRIEGLVTGADDYLTKPFSPDELLVRINNLIRQRKNLAEKFRKRITGPTSQFIPMSLDDMFISKARALVETNLEEDTFTVEKMAVELNVSRTQLLRKLKAITSLTPQDFIKDVRLRRAADMIQLRVDTIAQIGFAVGFSDQSYFTKCFKKKFFFTPTEYSNYVNTKNSNHVKAESRHS